jgi:DNA invertase Pin-like site-specific DNA recombinase/penicillin-binding protein-related factor A (putative recombinase)
MAKAISYIRFSASHQGRGSTVERQSEYIDEWLNKNPQIKLSNISAKDEGKSGYKGEHLNHGLGKILGAIQSGEIQSGDYILVEAIDRIGRLKPMVMMGLINEIVSKGVSIITLEDDTEYSIDSLNDNQSALFILIGKIQQAHNYSKSLSNRISAAYERKRREARSGQSISKITPYWLTSKGKIVPERGKIIKLCINLYIEGHSANSILKELSSKHPEFKKPHPETFKKWFKHKALIGIWDNQGDPIEDVFEPLIDKELFYTLQREIDRRYKQMSPASVYELSGLVRCGVCSAKFYFRTKKYTDYTIIYANCSNYLKNGKSGCVNNKTWPYEVLKEIAKRTVTTPIMTAAIKALSGQHTNKLLALQEELKGEDKKEESLIDLALSTNNSKAIKDRMSLIQTKQQQLNLQIREIEGELSSSNMVRRYPPEVLAAVLDKTESTPQLKQTILLAAKYQISINDNLASVHCISTGDTHTFTLIKRSTKYKCYIVHTSTLMTPVARRMVSDSFRNGGFTEEKAQNCTSEFMLAINREGRLAGCMGSDINKLLRNIEYVITDYKDYQYDP